MQLKLIQNKPLIWAHRGGRSLAAENTLHALRQAHDAGADGWETDVQLTKDGEVIILHDLNLLRTTNAGVHPLFKDNPPIVPWRFTLEEIKNLSAEAFPRRACPPPSSDHAWQDLPDSMQPELSVPTLTEALRLTAELGMWINVEIKDLSRAVPKALASTIVEKVLDIIATENMAEQVIISSFNHDYILESKERAPHILTGALTKHLFKRDPVKTVRAVKADAWHPGYRFLSRKAVQQARDAGLAINPYTVNKPEDMERLTQWGVTGIVTDCPQNAR